MKRTYFSGLGKSLVTWLKWRMRYGVWNSKFPIWRLNMRITSRTCSIRYEEKRASTFKLRLIFQWKPSMNQVVRGNHALFLKWKIWQGFFHTFQPIQMGWNQMPQPIILRAIHAVMCYLLFAENRSLSFVSLLKAWLRISQEILLWQFWFYSFLRLCFLPFIYQSQMLGMPCCVPLILRSQKKSQFSTSLNFMTRGHKNEKARPDITLCFTTPFHAPQPIIFFRVFF